jgi:hypothetical protein
LDVTDRATRPGPSHQRRVIPRTPSPGRACSLSSAVLPPACRSDVRVTHVGASCNQKKQRATAPHWASMGSRVAMDRGRHRVGPPTRIPVHPQIASRRGSPVSNSNPIRGDGSGPVEPGPVQLDHAAMGQAPLWLGSGAELVLGFVCRPAERLDPSRGGPPTALGASTIAALMLCGSFYGSPPGSRSGPSHCLRCRLCKRAKSAPSRNMASGFSNSEPWARLDTNERAIAKPATEQR